MILVNTNKPRNSKSTIEAVMRLRDTENEKFSSIMTEIGQTTDNILSLYLSSSGSLSDLLALLSRNHVLLRDLGVSCTEIENIVSTLD